MAIPLILKPKKKYELLRLGRNFDGGYLVGTDSLKKSEILISLGICDDWTFEKDFRFINNKCLIFCYDEKLIPNFLIKKFFKSIFFFRKFSFLKYFYLLIDLYKARIFKKINFIKKKISYNDLNQILNKLSSSDIFLKIDIEGSEYRLLDEILLNQDRFLGLVIEFHDFDYHKSTICNFVEKLNLTLVHIHPNNYSFININNDPNVLEFTFERNPKIIGDNNYLPHELDMNNNPFGSTVRLNFE